MKDIRGGLSLFPILSLVFFVLLAAEARSEPSASGYYVVDLPPGLNLVGLQLDADPDTKISSLFREVPDGTEIYQIENGAFKTNVFRGGQWARSEDALNVGEGFFLKNPASTSVVTTIGGTIFQGDLTNAIPAGLSMRCAIIPKAGRLTQDLGLKLSRFDNVYLLTNGILQTFTFLPDGSWRPFEPKVGVGQGIMIHASKPLNWVIHFSL
jgi:hypothetical protein